MKTCRGIWAGILAVVTDGSFNPAGIPACVTGNCNPMPRGNSFVMLEVTMLGTGQGGQISVIAAIAVDRIRSGA